MTPRPTPTRRDHKGPGLRDGARSDGARRSDAQLDLPAVVERLLPTPTTLLKTPTSNLGSNGGSQHPDKRKAGGHGPTLADEVEWTMPAALLPTPSASTYGTNQGGAAGRVGPVRESLDTMARNGRFDDALLPTPRATDGKHGRPGMSTSSGSPALPALAVEYAERWGIYAAAVARWETLTRPAPAPTVTSPRNGRPQLSPAFVEWMMGLPAGWVTDVAVTPKASSVRNAHLSLLGDGVVPQQAAYAFRLMLDELAHLVAVERAA